VTEIFAIILPIFHIQQHQPSLHNGITMNLKKSIRLAALTFGIIIILIQFIQPERENPPVDPAATMDASVNIPDDVHTILQRACADCHSNTTKWPFYSYIAPASWLVSYDVKEGRKRFNMSEWEKYKFSKKANIFGGIAMAVKDKEMPMPKYILLHPEADLTDAERTIVIQWAESEAMKMMGDE
jgi:uncharacterized membrane protein